MLIQCLIKRSGGTRVTMDDAEYHFSPATPEPGALHVASVIDKRHISRFLSIAEAYEYVEAEEADGPSPVIPSEEADKAKMEAEMQGEAAVLDVLEDPANVADETARAAFAYLRDRKAHHAAKTLTVVKEVINSAVERGFVDEADAKAMIQALEA